MKKLFIGASGLFGAIPGLAVIWKGIGSPPQYELLFGGVIEAFGVLSIIILWTNRKKLKAIPASKATNLAIILGVACFVFLVTYISLVTLCIVKHPTHGTVYYPLWTSGRIAELVTRAGGRWAALDKYGNYAIVSAINQMPVYVMMITTGLFLFVYQAIFTTLTLAFGALGFRAGRNI